MYALEYLSGLYYMFTSLLYAVTVRLLPVVLVVLLGLTVRSIAVLMQAKIEIDVNKSHGCTSVPAKSGR